MKIFPISEIFGKSIYPTIVPTEKGWFVSLHEDIYVNSKRQVFLVTPETIKLAYDDSYIGKNSTAALLPYHVRYELIGSNRGWFDKYGNIRRGDRVESLFDIRTKSKTFTLKQGISPQIEHFLKLKFSIRTDALFIANENEQKVIELPEVIKSHSLSFDEQTVLAVGTNDFYIVDV